MLKRLFNIFSLVLFVLIFFASFSFAKISNESVELKNNKIRFVLSIDNSQITVEKYSATTSWAKQNHSKPSLFSSDGNFNIKIFWTYWNAPGKINNSDLELSLDKNNFSVTDYNVVTEKSGIQKIVVNEKSSEYNFNIKIEYSLGKNDFFIKKKITIFDSEYGTHYCQQINPVNSKFRGIKAVIKSGGYGQPIAFSTKQGGGFVGIEYPIATTTINENTFKVLATEDIGEKITSAGVSGSWAVIGVTPENNVKFWFMKYLNSIRVAKLRPYTLYNSWYDLRSVDFPNVPRKYWMNEKNVFRIIDEIKSNFVLKHGISIDAFVLDDGWDIYASDWKLRTKQFPNGMNAISRKLKEINSTLGLWFGPTGGYSFRMKRINWMKAHGYEVVGAHGNWQPMMCIAGKNYKKLLKKRVTDFVKNASVGYYKWDGIQFSCSEPNHGHPIGKYSRRAVMESVADICGSVRKLNPDIFLNITSGTWLSPWWIKYANTIWMQGGDYGYSDVPSISSRDRAITYRDITLYNDFKKYDLWFPISNLMTHGIIKGELQKLGGEKEPLDKFTDNAVLYFARGVAMYELYISPDILSDDEWNSLAQALQWGKSNFDILMNTEMIGGNPNKSAPYGYAHFKDEQGIVAVRNPKIEDDKISFVLSSDFGLDKNVKNLVMEKIYPVNIFSDKLFKSGDTVSVNLQGFETAIYKFYPIDKTDKPIITGVDFIPKGKNSFLLAPTNKHITELNSGNSFRISNDEGNITIPELVKTLKTVKLSEKSTAKAKVEDENHFVIYPQLNENTQYAEIAVLFTNSSDAVSHKLPEIRFSQFGKELKSKREIEKNKWEWIIRKIERNIKSVSVNISSDKKIKGNLEIYLISYEKPSGKIITINKTSGKFTKGIYPPRPLTNGLVKNEFLIKKIKINLENNLK